MVKELISWIKAIVIALVIVLVVREFVMTPSVVKGTSMEPTLHDGDRIIISKLGELERFDQIAFIAPDSVVEENYVKRIIGLPGDYVEVKDDVLFINGVSYPEVYLEDVLSELDGYTYTDDFSMNELGLTEVPDGMYFVLGDNRPDSRDSRYFGAIEEESVIGEIVFRIWPPEDIGLLN